MAPDSLEPSLPPTERIHPASVGIDAKETRDVVEILHREDLRAWEAVGETLASVAGLADAAVAAFRAGGRLVYVGAGTSGRLGVLDASECPPTFGVEAWRVGAYIAGGDVALRRAVEGAEDSREAGAAVMAAARIDARDVVCGIAASGTTPYVWAALEEARRRGARTALVTCNPDAVSSAAAAEIVDHVVVLAVGPEVIAGSTRLKCGTATKQVLNLVTTAAMVRWGKVYDNLMIDLRPTNEKLRRRARCLIERLGGVSREKAAELFAATQDVKTAVVVARRGIPATAAKRLLDAHGGSLRRALEHAARGAAADRRGPSGSSKARML